MKKHTYTICLTLNNNLIEYLNILELHKDKNT
ncbi:hypothetical protein CHFL109739_08200 [Chryseobacterium flavum]